MRAGVMCALGSALIWSVGCNLSPKVPGKLEQAYPAAIKDSPDRRELAEKVWRQMLDAYNIPQTPPDLYPITYAPKSLLGIQNGIQIVAAGPDREKSPGITQESSLREAARTFVQRWRDLTGVDPAGISLEADVRSGELTKLSYKQMSYPFPIAGNFGQMILSLGSDGRLHQLDDRFIPVVDLPNRPAIDRDAAINALAGRALSYSNNAGDRQQVKIGGKADVSGSRLVVLPMEKSDAIEVHLAWEFTVGKPAAWIVYFDAINGGELTVISSSQS
jgi:hypothetical protein